MRWKWLLVLSLISISLVIVSGDDETEKVDPVDDSYDDDYEQKTDEVKAVEQTETVTADEEVPKVDEAEPPADEKEPENEDTVDVDPVPIAKQKGKYMNYDDYFVASALDGSDDGYNWNGKSHTQPTIDWHIIIIEAEP